MEELKVREYGYGLHIHTLNRMTKPFAIALCGGREEIVGGDNGAI
jgi:hypothetical protein